MKNILLLVVVLSLFRLQPAQFVGYETVVLTSPCRVYDSTPNPMPPNVASIGFEANDAAEFGSYIRLKDNQSYVPDSIAFTMSTWAPHFEWPSYPECGFAVQITLNFYNGNQVNSTYATVGTRFASIVRDFLIPWRPAPNGSCTDNKWKDVNGVCRSGLAFNIIYDLSDHNLTLPAEFIYGISFDTQNGGDRPFGVPGPYNSLNVGVYDTISVGSQVISGTTFERSPDTGNQFIITSDLGTYVPPLQIVSNSCTI